MIILSYPANTVFESFMIHLCRARRLDQWFREVLYQYSRINNAGRDAIRKFLGFEMSRELDISIQDRLALGLVEAARAEVAFATISLSLPSSSSPGTSRTGVTETASSYAGQDADIETMSQYSKNSHHSVSSHVSLTFRVNDDDMLSMQNYLLFNNKYQNEVPPLMVYYVINAQTPFRSPYLDPVKKTTEAYSDTIDDGIGSFWKSLSTSMTISSFAADDVFMDLSTHETSSAPIPVPKATFMKPSPQTITAEKLNTPRSVSPSSSAGNRRKPVPSGGSRDDDDDDDNRSMVSSIQQSKERQMLRIGLDDDDDDGVKKKDISDDSVSISGSVKRGVSRKGSIFGRMMS